MKDQNITIKRPSVLLLSMFGAGFFPKMPGTFASLLSIPLLMLLALIDLSFIGNALIWGSLVLISIYLTEKIQRSTNSHDPSWIVIDEFLGMYLTWWIFPPQDIVGIILIFVLFRFFDIIKIWPASYFDKEVKHGAGTIVDDLISGLYAGYFCHFVQNLVQHYAK